MAPTLWVVSELRIVRLDEIRLDDRVWPREALDRERVSLGPPVVVSGDLNGAGCFSVEGGPAAPGCAGPLFVV